VTEPAPITPEERATFRRAWREVTGQLELGAVVEEEPAGAYPLAETSRMALESIEPLAGTMRRQVLDAIAAAGDAGLTDDEGEQVTGLRHQTYSARRRELSACTPPLIVKSGERRPTRSGRKADAWVPA